MYVGNWDLASWGYYMVSYELNEAWRESRWEIMILVAYSWMNFFWLRDCCPAIIKSYFSQIMRIALHIETLKESRRR